MEHSNGFHLLEDDHPIQVVRSSPSDPPAINSEDKDPSSTSPSSSSPSSSSPFGLFARRRTAQITCALVLSIVFLPLLGALFIFLTREEYEVLPTQIDRLNCTDAPAGGANLVGVAYLPHGTMTLDPTRDGLPDGAAQLHAAGMRISRRIAQLQPDLLLLTTPHGLSLVNSTLLYLGTRAEGSSGWVGFWGEWTVALPMAGANTTALLRFLQQEEAGGSGNRSHVDGLTANGGGVPTPLHWGETVPLYYALHDWIGEYLPDAERPLKALDASVIPSPPAVLVMSQPMRASLQQASSIELGRSLRRFLALLPSSMRVVLLASGDLSHRHPWSTDLSSEYTPNPTDFPPAGQPIAKLFDDAVGNWLWGRTPGQSGGTGDTWTLDGGWLRDTMGPMIAQNAATCGYGGMLIQQGVMDGERIRNDSRVANAAPPAAEWEFAVDSYYNRAPSYFGMATAMYTSTRCLS